MRYVFYSGGCEVCAFSTLKDAKAELAKCKRGGINAYFVDTETGKEYQ